MGTLQEFVFQILEKAVVVAAAVALVKFLGQSLVKNYLDKSINNYKAILEKQNQESIERLRHDLSLVAMQKNITFNKLHEKRGEVIASIYALIADVKRHGIIYSSPVGYEGEDKDKQYENFVEKYNSLVEFFEKNKVYFPKETSKKLDDLIASTRDSFNKVSLAYKKIDMQHNVKGEKSPYTEWNEAWHYFKDEIEVARELLEGDFRQMLGVESGDKREN